jgi:hypothetical protein
MAEPENSKKGFSSARRLLIAFNAVVGLMALVAIVVMLNFVASGHPRRFQWAQRSLFKLSPQTASVLSSLTNDVTVTIHFDPREQSDIYSLTSGLLNEYQNANPRFIHVKSLDYRRFPGDERVLLDRLHLNSLKERDFVVFEANGRSKLFYANQLSGYDINEFITGRSKTVRRDAFKGEMYFTSAIFAVCYPRDVRTYFVYGHGEGYPGNLDASDDPRKASDIDFTKLASVLKDEINSDCQKLSLQGTNPIPSDCQLLVIARPSNAQYDTDEVDKLDAYLKSGGRLLILLDHPRGLEALLNRWDVSYADLPVKEHDPAHMVSNDQGFFAEPAPHPITNPLIRDELLLYLGRGHPVGRDPSAAKRPGGPEITVLAHSSRLSTVGTPPNSSTNAFPLICTIEQGVVKDLKASRVGGTRIVVSGDGYFLDDQMIDTCAANHYFATLALNWLLERPDVLLKDLGPSPIREYKLELTRTQLTQLRWLFLAAMPGSVLLAGTVVWLRRRH